MKIISIVVPNTKGQIVIPKDMREAVGLKPGVPVQVVKRGTGIYLYPIHDVITTLQTETAYTRVLEKTRGAWAGDSWDDTAKKRSSLEKKASDQRKQSW